MQHEGSLYKKVVMTRRPEQSATVRGGDGCEPVSHVGVADCFTFDWQVYRASLPWIIRSIRRGETKEDASK
jgi:hypothetical protein